MSRKEIEKLQILLKSLDIRREKGEVDEQEYQELREKYSNMLKEQKLLLSEDEILDRINAVVISGSGKVTPDMISIAGSGKVDLVDIGVIKIAGSGIITNNSIKTSGSSSLPGDLDIGYISASGSVSVNGSVTANVFLCSGSYKVDGSVIASETVSLSGAGKVNGKINSQGTLEVDGRIKINGSVEAAECSFKGTFKVVGDVRCSENFIAELNKKSTIEGNLLADGDVYITKQKKRSTLVVPSIISKGKVYVEGVRANIIEAKEIELGPDCEVKKVNKIEE